jgi:hypothetical protein
MMIIAATSCEVEFGKQIQVTTLVMESGSNLTRTRMKLSSAGTTILKLYQSLPCSQSIGKLISVNLPPVPETVIPEAILIGNPAYNLLK